LDEDEKEGLLLKSIATKGELDEFEQQNIEEAMLWTLKRKFSAGEIFSEEFVRRLHQRMYGDVWRWAGEFRRTNKNIGVDKYIIGIELRQLLDDALYWWANKTFEPDEKRADQRAAPGGQEPPAIDAHRREGSPAACPSGWGQPYGAAICHRALRPSVRAPTGAGGCTVCPGRIRERSRTPARAGSKSTRRFSTRRA
jgi:hypothetical protein